MLRRFARSFCSFPFLAPGMMLIALLALASSIAEARAAGAVSPTLPQLQQMIQRYAPTELKADTRPLPPNELKCLAKLIEAARVLNPLFMEQLWEQNLKTWREIERDSTPLGRARREYYRINKGPWSDLDEHAAFLPGVPRRKPAGANFYPADMTKQEFESWVKTLPEKEQEAAHGFFTVIRRVYQGEVSEQRGRKLVISGKGSLIAIPYSEEYRTHLTEAARLLREAAGLTENATLKRFLSTRADAFLSNDYYASDVAWMELDSPIDITIGPYETYNDELFGYKASFEAYINLRDDAETKKLETFAHVLQEVENNLPEDARYRNPKLGAAAPIRVVNEIFASGDGGHGVQAAAYNLPNDERVVREKGSKRVMLKNVQEAKFRSVLLPIAGRTLEAGALPDVSFEWFFNHILAHELMHGLGPHQITGNGRATEPRKELRELYGAIEEAKADATGLWALQFLMKNAARLNLSGLLPAGEAAERRLYTTYLASTFRTLRFGTNEAHGKGMAMQFNYLLDQHGFTAQPGGTFAVDLVNIKQAVRNLTHDLLTLEATGDYAEAKKMLDTLGIIRPETKIALDKLRGIPVDIDPRFVTADGLSPEPVATKTNSAPGSVPGSINDKRQKKRGTRGASVN